VIGLFKEKSLTLTLNHPKQVIGSVQAFFLVSLSRYFLPSSARKIRGVNVKRKAQSIKVTEKVLNIF